MLAICLTGFTTGIIRVKSYSVPWKLIVAELLVVSVMQGAALALLMMHRNNLCVINWFIIIDLLLLGTTGILLLKKITIKQFFVIFLGIVLIICLASTLDLGLGRELNSVSFLSSGIYLCTLFLVILLQVSTATFPFGKPEGWLSLAIIIYFGCNVPFFSLFHYLSTDKVRWSKLGVYLYFINTGLSFIRYGLVTYSIILLNRRGGVSRHD